MSEDPSLRGLERTQMFSNLASEDLRAILAISRETGASRQTLLFTQDSPCSAFYQVLSGRVQVMQINPDGREQILKTAGPGDIIADAAVLTGFYPASAQVTRDARLLVFPSGPFWNLIEHRPQIAANMLRIMAHHLLNLTRLVQSLSLQEVPARIAKSLLDMHARSGDGRAFKLTLTKKAWAHSLGTTPESLSRSLSRFKQEKLLAESPDGFRIIDQDGLQAIAAGI
ncbi:MAG TPA: Crp/Fnr family transcriptional regulator [Candidatus Ozemobacteraceae bacterium]|nr:Crp/Fnr family transcriptional regulator [Candidatus Ozemobacteraceae bacterium]